MAKQNDEILGTIQKMEREQRRNEFMKDAGGDLITAGIALAVAGGITVYDMIKNRKNKGKKKK